MSHKHKHGSAHSGGQRIDDHSFFAGKASHDSVFPKGVHTKDEHSAEGSGSVMSYEDTTEKIKEQQMHGDGKVKSHPMKPSYRN